MTAAVFSSRFFPDATRAENGLQTLLRNAVEHGCLGIGHDMKGRLMADNMFENEIIRRLTLPENRVKSIEILITRKEEGVFAVITDPGDGFNWKDWINIAPDRRSISHGHGIARAKAQYFDGLTYNAKGNQVAAFMRASGMFDW